MVYVWEIEGLVVGICSLLLPCGSQGLNSGHQAWSQELLSTESSH